MSRLINRDFPPRQPSRLAGIPAERQIIRLIANQIDRKTVLAADWDAATDSKVRVKLAAELRLLESSIAKLLRKAKANVPQPMSQRSMKAQRAANIRWARDTG